MGQHLLDFWYEDMLREGVRESVEAARESGVRIVMITGDHKLTAETIAREAEFIETEIL